MGTKEPLYKYLEEFPVTYILDVLNPVVPDLLHPVKSQMKM